MKLSYILYITAISLIIISCSLNEDAGLKEEPIVGFDGTFLQEDRAGRPAINIALIAPNRKDTYNLTVAKDVNRLFRAEIKSELEKLSPAFSQEGDLNVLNQDLNTLSNLLATDVLNVSLKGKTTFFDGTNVLTGRTLEDDVLDTELLLIFGGEDGTENPTLTTDNVSSNDKAFQTKFPYLPTPW